MHNHRHTSTLHPSTRFLLAKMQKDFQCSKYRLYNLLGTRFPISGGSEDTQEISLSPAWVITCFNLSLATCTGNYQIRKQRWESSNHLIYHPYHNTQIDLLTMTVREEWSNVIFNTIAQASQRNPDTVYPQSYNVVT